MKGVNKKRIAKKGSRGKANFRVPSMRSLRKQWRELHPEVKDAAREAGYPVEDGQ